MRPAVIFGALVIAILVGAAIVVVTTFSAMNTHIAPPTVDAPIAVDPAVVDLGQISQCNPPITVKATLVNMSKEPAELSHAVVACGCTVPDLLTPLVLQPGERREFTVALDPWGQTGKRSQNVDFACTQPGRPRSLRISFESISQLHTNPGSAKRAAAPAVPVRLIADDEQPFEVLSVDPPVVSSWARNVASANLLSVEWALVDSLAADPAHAAAFEYDANHLWTRGVVTVKTSHPHCETIHFRIYNASQIARSPAGADPDPSGGSGESPATKPDAPAAPPGAPEVHPAGARR